MNTASDTTSSTPGLAQAATPLVSVRGLSKSYGSVPAVVDVSFDVPEGRITGFIGPNGAGKSTVLKAALGLLVPDAGVVTVAGRPYADVEAPARTVGALLSAETLPARMTVRGFLTYVATTQGLPRTAVREAIDLVGLQSATRKRIGGLSLGMRQRVGLAAALVGQPRLLVLDEPLNGLDTDAILALRTLLRSLAVRGTTILLSSHLMAELARVVDHVVIIRAGRLVAEGPLTHFQSDGRTLEDAYLELVHG